MISAVFAEPACPLCGASGGAEMRAFHFRSKRHLPDRTRILSCDACDFVYSWPRDAEGYEGYYREVANDFVHTLERFRNTVQLERISGYISRHRLTRVLDFGCGGGGLLTALAARHPDVLFVGYDVNAGPPSALANLRFTVARPEASFDLVILSHVLEHAVAPGAMIRGITTRFAPRFLYLEVPDPTGYAHISQPQYLYYVDRLHINHFSAAALLRAAGPDYTPLAAGAYIMPYNLGPEYPSQFLLLSTRSAAAPPGGAVLSQAAAVRPSIEAYFAGEAERTAGLRHRLSGQRFHLYGYGDNCLRSLSDGGPLCGLEDRILGVIDRSIGDLGAAMPPGWERVHPDEMARLNGAMIVCTAARSDELQALFASRCPLSEVVYL